MIKILSKFGFNQSTLKVLDDYTPRDGFQFLHTEEYQNMIEYFSQYTIYQNIIPLLTDNNSNYICVYKDGLLFGKVCYLDHEEPSLEPKFKDIQSLITAINANLDCWDLRDFPETVFDYPQTEDEYFTDEDKELLSFLKNLFIKETDEDIKTQIAFCIMSLIPPKYLMDIYPFLDNEDMYIQERAIKTFGFHKYKPVIEKLKELQETAKHNGKFAAKLALKRIMDCNT